MSLKLPVVAAALLVLGAPALAQEYTVLEVADRYVAPPGGATTVIDAGEDDVTETVELPFVFAFYGRLYEELSISSNGWTAFGETTATARSNPVLPSTTAPDAVAAPLWDDLVTGTGSVVTHVEGAAPGRAFVVTWLGVDTFSGASDDSLSFQLRLFEGSGEVEFAYAATGVWGALSYTAGLEDETGTLATGGPNTAADNSGQPTVDQRFVPRGVSLIGRLLRDRPVADETGLGNSEETGLPLVDVAVVATRTDDGAEVGRAQTDPAGFFNLQTFAVPAGVEVDLELRVEGAAARVTTAAGGRYDHVFATDVRADLSDDLGQTTLDADVDGLDAGLRPALNIHQASTRGLALARNWADAAVEGSATPAESFLPLQIRWAPGRVVPGGGQYVPATDTTTALADLNGEGGIGDAYDDDVVLREYAHHVFATISDHPGTIGLHQFAFPTSPQAALVDGFAYWFATQVQGRNVFIDTLGPDEAAVIDLAAPFPVPDRSPATAGAIAASFWDLTDPADADHDRFAGTQGLAPSTAAEVFATIDLALDEALPGTTFDAFDFFDAWRDGGADEDRVATARLFIHHGALADDDFEANDDEGEERDFPAGAQLLGNLTLNPFNQDRFAVEFAGDDRLQVFLRQTRTTDLDLVLEDAGGTEIIRATTQGATDKSSVQLTSATDLPAGRYLVRVEWVGGAPTPYSLSFASPLLLDRTELPTWTQGLPFKQDFGAVGGLAPYTFEVVAAVPGLTLVNDSTRLQGTPSEAGDFTVSVTVTDSNAPATSVQVDVPLTIRPPLSLAPRVGLVAGRAETVALGTGGTNAEWETSTTPPAGLTLIGGARLELTGTAQDAGVFDVDATAEDERGASLPSASSRVLVAPFLPRSGSVAVPAGDEFALAFDALVGTEADVRLRFRGTGSRPTLVRAMTADGTEVAVGRVAIKRRVMRLRDIVAPASGTLFLVFDNGGGTATPFTGTVSARTKALPRRRDVGQVGIDAFLGFSEATFQGVAGSSVTIRARRGLAPSNLRPVVFSVTAPSGEALELPRQRRQARGKRVVLRGLTLPETGTYTVRFSGDVGTTGPLRYTVRQRFAKGARVVLDD